MSTNHYFNNGIKKQQTFSWHLDFPGIYQSLDLYFWAFYSLLSILGKFMPPIIQSLHLFSLPWESDCLFSVLNRISIFLFHLLFYYKRIPTSIALSLTLFVVHTPCHYQDSDSNHKNSSHWYTDNQQHVFIFIIFI